MADFASMTKRFHATAPGIRSPGWCRPGRAQMAPPPSILGIGTSGTQPLLRMRTIAAWRRPAEDRLRDFVDLLRQGTELAWATAWTSPPPA
ncbi:MAG: hypothetical protein RIB84_25330 [Sneathiellaceae bacterium]